MWPAIGQEDLLLERGEMKAMTIRKPFRKEQLAIAVSSIIAGTGPQAMAQSAESEADTLEEIVVTASRREQNILDVPYNITAVSGEDIEAAVMLDNAELLRSVPGVGQVDMGPRNGSQFNSIRIRGINVDGSAFGDYAVSSVATVATYVNDTPVFADLALVDLERVEVLRGPQGTLYGSGALGGTIKYLMREPQFDSTDFSAGAVITSVDGSSSVGYGTTATLNVSASDTFAIRANINWRDYPGITDYVNLYELDSNGVPPMPNGIFDRGYDSTNYLSEKDADTFESLYARVSARWQPNEKFDAVITYIHQDDDIGGRRQQTDGLNGIGEPYRDYENGAVIREPYERDFDFVAAELDVDFGFATLTSATSTYDNNGGSETDNTGFYANNFANYYYFYPRPLYTAVRTFKDEAFVQEIRLVSSGDNKVDYAVGAFYRDQERGSSQISDLVGFEAWADAAFFPGDFVSTDNVVHYERTEDYSDFAAFGEVTWHVNERVHLTGGLRYFDTETDINTFVRVGAYDSFAGSVETPFKSSEDDTIFKFNVAVDFGDDDLFYTTVSEGYRRGGNNGVPTIGRFANDPGWVVYTSDTVNNLEVGIKGIWGSTRYDISAFSMDWDDPQFNTSAPNGSFFAVVNGDEAETSGLELQLSGPIGDKFSYAFGYAYVDAKVSADIYTPINIFSGLQELVADSGTPLPGIAENSVNLALEYTTSLTSALDLNLRTDGFYQSKTQNTLDPSILQAAAFPGFSIWDLSATIAADRWYIALFAKNIFNEEGRTGAFTADQFGTVPAAEFYGSTARQFMALPRTIGVSVNYDF
jgi:outer membrane receptor protein involved in Fe transport